MSLDSRSATATAAVLGAGVVVPAHCDGWAHFSEGVPEIGHVFYEAGPSSATDRQGADMPLVRIDLIRGRRPDELRAIADATHRALVDVLHIPERDRFQLITEHDADHVIALDAGLGFARTDRLVLIQIFTQSGRTTEVKQRVFRAVAEQLEHLGIGGEDVFVSIVENGPQDWSFGFGRAQYTEGALPVPGR